MSEYCSLDIRVCGCDRYKYYVNVSVFLFETICVCVFLDKTEGYNVTVLTYVYVHACIYVRETKVPKSGECICMCEVILTSMKSPAHGSLANIPIL